mgnify:CR=1 FL=1
MKDMTRVLEEYRRGDFYTRLHLFLECRALRKAFMTIEQEEASAEVPAAEESGRAGQGRSTPFSLPRDETYGSHLERPLPKQEIP